MSKLAVPTALPLMLVALTVNTGCPRGLDARTLGAAAPDAQVHVFQKDAALYVLIVPADSEASCFQIEGVTLRVNGGEPIPFSSGNEVLDTLPGKVPMAGFECEAVQARAALPGSGLLVLEVSDGTTTWKLTATAGVGGVPATLVSHPENELRVGDRVTARVEGDLHVPTSVSFDGECVPVAPLDSKTSGPEISFTVPALKSGCTPGPEGVEAVVRISSNVEGCEGPRACQFSVRSDESEVTVRVAPR